MWAWALRLWQAVGIASLIVGFGGLRGDLDGWAGAVERLIEWIGPNWVYWALIIGAIPLIIGPQHIASTVRRLRGKPPATPAPDDERVRQLAAMAADDRRQLRHRLVTVHDQIATVNFGPEPYIDFSFLRVNASVFRLCIIGVTGRITYQRAIGPTAEDPPLEFSRPPEILSDDDAGICASHGDYLRFTLRQWISAETARTITEDRENGYQSYFSGGGAEFRVTIDGEHEGFRCALGNFWYPL